MSLDPPAYILSLENNIRARPISWEGAVRAKTITESDLKKIKAIDKVRKEQRKQTIEGDIDAEIDGTQSGLLPLLDLGDEDSSRFSSTSTSTSTSRHAQDSVHNRDKRSRKSHH